MTEEQLIRLLNLAQIPGVGPLIARNLLAYAGGADKVFDLSASKLAKIPSVGPKLAEKIAAGASADKAKKELEYCSENNIKILTYNDELYPEKLKTIYDAPLILFAKGNLTGFAKMPSAAVVGTRKASSYGKKAVSEIVNCLSAAGVSIVSGMAYGIDIEAHRAALEAKGFTAAVMASGFKQIYPAAHKNTYEKILETGVVFTEYFSDERASAYTFPQRNRIISGICAVTVVAESPLKGGSLITAQLAFDQNREVYAVPGNWGQKSSEGTNALIRDNIAKLLSDPKEILTDMGWEALKSENPGNHKSFSAAPYHQLEENERKIIESLQNAPLLIDQIEIETGINVGSLLSYLITLEFKGWVETLPGKKYKRIL